MVGERATSDTERWCLILIVISAALSGCVRQVRDRGEPRNLPSGLSWCSKETIAKFGQSPPRPLDSQCRLSDLFCRVSAVRMQQCIPYLSRELPEGKVHGRFLFGVSSDEQGSVTDVCLISSDLGDTPLALLCAAEVARRFSPRVRPNVKEEVWHLTWTLD